MVEPSIYVSYRHIPHFTIISRYSDADPKGSYTLEENRLSKETARGLLQAMVGAFTPKWRPR